MRYTYYVLRIPYAILSLTPFSTSVPVVGGFGETAFFHKSTKTLLVTDAIIQEDPRALLYHARDDMFEVVKDTPRLV